MPEVNIEAWQVVSSVFCYENKQTKKWMVIMPVHQYKDYNDRNNLWSKKTYDPDHPKFAYMVAYESDEKPEEKIVTAIKKSVHMGIHIASKYYQAIPMPDDLLPRLGTDEDG